jgi:hypothetical protein
MTKKWDGKLINTMRALRKQDVAILVATDEVGISQDCQEPGPLMRITLDKLSFQDDTVCAAERGHKLS